MTRVPIAFLAFLVALLVLPGSGPCRAADEAAAGQGGRFSVPEGFTIEQSMRDDEVGSLVAMAFDASGNIIASRERGPLLLIQDTDNSGAHDKATVFCDKVQDVRGLLVLEGAVYAVGMGPTGAALYRLADADGDGVAERVDALVQYKGLMGEDSLSERGPHSVRLGPDGLLYGLIGNGSAVAVPEPVAGPMSNVYEGDLLRPRYEDPRGYAEGVKVPGGVLFRADAAGRHTELVAAGLRNAQDFAFSPTGEVFALDSEMPWDQGAPWYRPSRVLHMVQGADFGWRSGWAKWPGYFLDTLPATLDVGPGSPSGVTFYRHTVFPKRYHGALLACDWARGRIYAVYLKREGASFSATSEVLLEGRPLNVTDAAVGPDGALYFVTGLRGTEGGVFRLRWTGEPGAKAAPVSGIESAIRQPQPDSAWGRAQTLRVRSALGNRWGIVLDRIAQDTSRDAADRVRALHLMMMFGPQPAAALLEGLARDDEPLVRAKAASLMLARASSPDVLVGLLSDKDALVRRTACEVLVRNRSTVDPAAVVPLLGDEDRFVANAARRLVEQLPVSGWRGAVLGAEEPLGVFLMGGTASVTVEENRAASKQILSRCERLLADNEGRTVGEVLGILRLCQLAMLRGGATPADAPGLPGVLLELYPTGTSEIDREIVRLLVHCDVPQTPAELAAQISAEIPQADKIHIAACAARQNQGWDTDTKFAMLDFFEKSRGIKGGYSVGGYLERFARDFFTKLTPAEVDRLLATGEQWPFCTLSLLARMPAEPGVGVLNELERLDGRVKPLCEKDDAQRRLRIGIIAVLGRTTNEKSHAYLRTVYQNEPDERETVAMSLTQNPGEGNWPYLVDSLKTVEGVAAREVLVSLMKVGQRPTSAEPYRQVILQGLRLGDQGGEDAVKLLEHWAGSPLSGAPWQQRLTGWQQKYADSFPGAPPAELPVDSDRDRWTYDELLSYLQGPGVTSGDATRGREVYVKARCASCHRKGGEWDGPGPDLTGVARRFQKKEILQSIVFPSHMISDEYASTVVEAGGKKYTGIVASHGEEGISLWLGDGRKVDIPQDAIKEVIPTAASLMPEGLLNGLTLEEVGDLFAFLVGE